MRILLTGFTGLLGQELTSHLVGHELYGVSRTAKPHASLKGVWTWDEISAAVEGMDVVIHLSGESVVGRWTEAKKKAIRESRIESTKQLVQAMQLAKKKPRRFLCASAVGYYGERGEEALHEFSVVGTGFLAETCAAWEKEARLASLDGIQVASLRIGIVLSQKGGALKEMLPAFQWGAGGALGTGAQWMPWIHIHDVCAAILFLASAATLHTPVYNLTAPNPVRQTHFAHALGKVLRRPTFMKVPAFALKLAVGEFSEEVLKSVHAKPQALLDAGFKFQYSEVDQALQELCGVGLNA